MDKNEKVTDKPHQTRNFDFSKGIFGVVTRVFKENCPNSVHG